MQATIKQSGRTATIDSKGAELISFKNEVGKEFMWEGNPAFWGKHSPVLFPIVGSLRNNRYQYNHTEYTLSRHGFARDMDFVIVRQTESEVVFLLSATAETLTVYPFDFELQISYSLNHGILTVGYTVSNKSQQEMPFSIGAHPAFALPGNFESYQVEMERDELLQYHLLDNGLLTEPTAVLPLSQRKFRLNYGLFEHDALVFKSIQSQALTILDEETPVVRVTFKGFPNLGIWTVQNAPFLCIEPWYGYSDTITASGNLLEKEGIILLPAAETFNAAFSIEIF